MLHDYPSKLSGLHSWGETLPSRGELDSLLDLGHIEVDFVKTVLDDMLYTFSSNFFPGI